MVAMLNRLLVDEVSTDSADRVAVALPVAGAAEMVGPRHFRYLGPKGLGVRGRRERCAWKQNCLFW
jgi:hypothetical protein